MRPVNLAFVAFALCFGRAHADDKACLDCHQMIQAIVNKGQIHPAMAMGCQTCHTDHRQSSTNPAGHYLKSAPSTLCLSCHPDIVKKEFVHEPVKRDCTLCHSPHASLQEGLRAQSNALCLECHSDASKSKFEASGPVKLFDGRVTIPPHYFENLPLLALRDGRGHPVSNHPVFWKEDANWPALSCTVCHKPHGADKTASLLVTEDANYFETLCQRCHK